MSNFKIKYNNRICFHCFDRRRKKISRNSFRLARSSQCSYNLNGINGDKKNPHNCSKMFLSKVFVTKRWKVIPQRQKKKFSLFIQLFWLSTSNRKEAHNGWWLREDENNDELATTATSTATIKSVEINSKHFIEIFYLLLSQGEKTDFSSCILFLFIFMVLFLNFLFRLAPFNPFEKWLWCVCECALFAFIRNASSKRWEANLMNSREQTFNCYHNIRSCAANEMENWSTVFLLEFNCGFGFPTFSSIYLRLSDYCYSLCTFALQINKQTIR